MTKSDKDTTSLAAANIEKLHELLAANLSEAFKPEVAIGESKYRERMDWEQLRNPVSFVLRAREAGENMRYVFDPTNGRRQVVLRLEPDPNVDRCHAPLNWWVAWSEQWQPSGRIRRQYQFSFEKAAWRLYCTDENDKDTLLVRAEWDRPDEDRSRNAAQPHWHVHHEQKIGIAAVAIVPGQTESVPADGPVPPNETHPDFDEEVRLQAMEESALTIPPGRCVEIRDIHLGMARWDNEGVHPKCWQAPFGDLEQTMPSWAVATLQYMRTQLCYVRFAQPD